MNVLVLGLMKIQEICEVSLVVWLSSQAIEGVNPSPVSRSLIRFNRFGCQFSRPCSPEFLIINRVTDRSSNSPIGERRIIARFLMIARGMNRSE
jgi:hypothetical protein